MYGYITPKKEQLKTQDFVLYRAFYCGICKLSGSKYGQFSRFTTNYDLVFLSVLLHDCAGQEVEFANGTCILNPIKKKATVCKNALLDKIVAANVLLAYYKIKDDINDKDGRTKSKIAGSLLKKAYGRAREELPNVEAIISQNYQNLATLERQGTPGIDRASHHFSKLLMDVAGELLEGRADQNTLKLCYNVGKFVYLIDALDDIGDDFKKKRYNPFLAEYGSFKNRKKFISDNYDAISFILSVTVNRAIECFNNMKFSQSYDLLRNIVHIGLREKCDEVLKSTKKLPKPRI